MSAEVGYWQGMRKLLAISASTALALGGAAILTGPTQAAAPGAQSWEIGPIIKGRNYSVNMPLRPQTTREGPSFEFPSVPDNYGHVHYMTFNPGSLRGAKSLTIRYRIDAPRGTRFLPQEDPSMKAYLSLYFQRSGDNWSAKRQYEHYRWYSPDETMIELKSGTFEATMPLDGRWHSVGFRRSAENPDYFASALNETQRVGFVMGHKQGRGHGVYATAPARFTLLDFRINR